MRGWLANAVWAYSAWVLITWTRTAEQLLFGAGLAALVALALAPLGPVLEPWRLLDPRRLWSVVRIAAHMLVNMVRANIHLSRLIWSPWLTRGALRPGMLVVPSDGRSDGFYTAVGVLTSLIVDNQIIDLARSRHRLQYHAVQVDSEDPDENRASINGPLEELLEKLGR